jgi:GPH family glycoside/pentoside/hexuronide:cation symporter
MPSPATGDPSARVPLRTKVLWGCGGLADNFMFNTMTALGTLVYVNHFGLSPALAGMALGLPRIVDAITDPWVGNLSDQWRGRHGRRRPLMFFGVIGCALLLPLLWTVPFASTASNPWHSNIPFLYIVVVGSLLATAYTFFVIPYTALGFELSPDYDERTRIVRWRMIIGLGGSLAAGWLFRLAASERFEDLGTGAFWTTVGVAAIVLVSGMLPVFGTPERPPSQPPERLHFAVALRDTLANAPFRILFIAYITIIVALFSAQGIAPLLLQHHVFGGDARAMGSFQGWLGTLAVGMSYGSIFLIGWISVRTSKRTAMMAGLALALVGTLANYWAMDPRWPGMMFATAVVTFLGLQGCWLMVDSMTADVCDEDALRTGRRREGMFSAVKGFALKAAQGLTFGVGGAMATWAGYEAQTVSNSGLAPDVAERMKFLLIGFQAAGLLLALVLMRAYPIDRERSEENRRRLRAREQATG